MWCVALIFIAIASCNAELYSVKTTELPAATPNRIIGGNATTIQQYPYAVQIISINTFLCGGSLLTASHVLSAGQCFVDYNGNQMPANRYLVRLGTTTLNSGGTLHQVSAIRVHESYNNWIRDNDVAVVVLATSVNFATSVAQIASIPNQGNVVPDNSSVIAVGWGLTNVNSSAPSVMNEVTVRKINRTICQNRYLLIQEATGTPHPITDNMICAGILDVGGNDVWLGEAGGPLIYNGVVVGLTSWSAGDVAPFYPVVYTRVSSYTNWISNVVQSTNGNGTTTTNQPPTTTQPPTTNPGTNTTNPGGNTGTLNSRVGAVTLLAPVLYLILSV